MPTTLKEIAKGKALPKLSIQLRINGLIHILSAELNKYAAIFLAVGIIIKIPEIISATPLTIFSKA